MATIATNCTMRFLTLAGERDRPQAVVAHTVKGKGVSFMEGQFAWHGKPVLDADYHRAKAELACSTSKEGSDAYMIS